MDFYIYLFIFIFWLCLWHVEVPRPETVPKPQFWPMPQLNFNPLCWAKDPACVPALPRHCWSHCATVETQIFFLDFWGPNLHHMEVPRLGVESELQQSIHATAVPKPDTRHICDLHHSSQQCQILNPLSEAGDWTHILRDASWVCYCWATTELLNHSIYFSMHMPIPNPQSISPIPPPVPFGNHKFFKVCESVSVLQKIHLHTFFLSFFFLLFGLLAFCWGFLSNI